ncbi:MAG: hypothetical protein R3Y09_05225 [Clostridia bacterium]
MKIEKHYVEEEYVMNKKQKWEHYWEYYKWHTIVAIIILCTIVTTVIELMNKVEPDYILGFISPQYISDEVLDEMEEQISQYGLDINNDGEVITSIYFYQLDYDDTSAMENITANTTRLYADLSGDEVFIYIVDGINTYSHIIESGFEDVDGNLLESYSKTGVEADETLYGYAFADTQIFDGISYYGNDIYDYFGESRVMIVSDIHYEDSKDDVKQLYQDNLELYNKILEN